MKKFSLFFVVLSFLAVICAGATSFASDKKSEEVIDPVWIHLADQTETSDHNPNGTLVKYGMDIASVYIHRNTKDFGFWLAKITKAKNEIDITYVRIAKDKSYYREVQKQLYYLDGTFKSAEVIQNGVKKPLTGDEVFYNAPEIYNKNKTITVSDMDVPELPSGFNRMQIMSGKPGFEKWLCILDNRSTGTDSQDSKKLTLVTYAYNMADRVYYKGITYVERTGGTSYNITGGNAYLYTFEDKLLAEKDTTPRPACFISDKDLDKTVSYKFMFYKEKRKAGK